MLPKHLPHIDFVQASSLHLILHLAVVFEFECDLLVFILVLLYYVCAKLLTLIGQQCEYVVAGRGCRVDVLVARLLWLFEFVVC